MTLEEQLASVLKAIAAIEAGGQEIDIEVNENRRRVVRAKLKDLYDREAKLRMAIRRRDGGSIYHVR
ncbi:MAG TPA: hypothetical protein VFO10_19530 [Oligoflexus sp.]|uniref:hypothetical protein n=1 Tax=Oligoflexus sp. TaxID=1971216 RepID=UPI002D7FFC59|nr:hypothetical protein [Oligoflexus sp.]HET9239463.1 hypothetical protein [Oligoflexus sp.]